MQKIQRRANGKGEKRVRIDNYDYSDYFLFRDRRGKREQRHHNGSSTLVTNIFTDVRPREAIA